MPRYIRLRGWGPGNFGHFAVSEVYLYETAGGTDRAAGSTVTATSTTGGYPASNVIDRNGSTWWNSNGIVQGSEGLTFDFGSGNDYNITRISIRPRDSWPSQMPDVIEVGTSNNGTTWTTLPWILRPAGGWSSGVTVNFDRPSFPTNIARYYGVVMWTAQVGNTIMSLGECSLHNGGANLLAGASFPYDNHSPPNVSSRAVDGNATTFFGWNKGSRALYWFADVGTSGLYLPGNLTITATSADATNMGYTPDVFSLVRSSDAASWEEVSRYDAATWSLGSQQTFTVPGGGPMPVGFPALIWFN